LVTVLLISSHVVAGRVGDSVALPAFAALGLEAWSLPTVIYSQTPGPKGFAGAAVPGEIFDAVLDRFEADGAARQLAAIHIGYVREAAQALRIARFSAEARQLNPQLVVSLDPVLGDEGRLYIPEPTAEAIKAVLVPLADLITPNAFELGWLTGRPVDGVADARSAARRLGCRRALVTSVPLPDAALIGTLLVEREPDAALLASTPRFAQAPHGTGDLLAALFLGRLLRSEAPADALALSVASVHDLIARTAGGRYLPVTEHLHRLAAPESRFDLVHLPRE
jgi:pyridoxine kinase